MKAFFLCVITLFVITITGKIYPQQSELVVRNIFLESSNSLTFDVFINNTGATNWTYSNGSFAWTFDTAFLNGGNATFSLVPGYSDFSVGAHPPSALITSPNILRTSSNMPAANGNILAGQSLRLFRFRFQTSASSFTGSYFPITWKSSVTPYTRIFSWDTGTGLPTEIQNVEFSNMQLMLEENFDYGGVPNSDLLAVTTNWTRHSGTAGSAYLTSSLSYPSYLSSGIGGSDWFTRGASGVNDGDVNRVFPTAITTTSTVYAAFLFKLDSARATADYFFHFGPGPIGTIFRGRVFARSNGIGWSLGLSKSTEAAINDNTVLNFGQTYLFVLKYSFNTATTSDDVVSLYLYDSDYPETEPGSPLVTIGPTGVGTASDPLNIGSVAIRQGTNTPTGNIDGIRVSTDWSEIFPQSGTSIVNVSPSSLSGFTYTQGSGPSASQSYNLSGSNLTPASGNITVTGSASYEVSLNNVTFGANANVPYSGGALTATAVYVRLKAGLTGGEYNGELVTNSGGGAPTQNVTCSGFVVAPEPSNHVTNFSGSLGTPSYYHINLTWTDASGGTQPDGYLIKGSPFMFDSIPAPVDGVPETNSLYVQNVAQGLQAETFGLNSGTTYYFKIFPYTNSGTFINYKINGSVPQLSISTNNAPSLPLVENFDYATGSNLTANGWIAHSGAGTNPIMVNATPLTYTGYVNSGLGKSVTMMNNGEDDNRAFTGVATGSVYSSFMVNITSAQLTGDYIFHLGPENTTILFYSKVFVKKNAADSLSFGVAKRNNSEVVYTPFNYALNTTYLIVVKYTFNSGTTTDDEVKLWINPVLDGTEPAANLTQNTDTGEDALSLGMFALRQGAIANAAGLILGGIRIASTWVASSSSTFQLSVDVINSWNMVSVPGTNTDGMGVNTWWAFRDLGANVFRFTGSYTQVLITDPGEGYWMKHNGPRTYNTGDEWPAGGIQIVSHDPIGASLGWNLVGGYDVSVPVGSVTTTPPGLINATIFGFNGSYTPATHIVPGYAYWIKLSAAGSINIGGPLGKEGAQYVQSVKEDWGKIIITDASGKTFTLYAAEGQVDLNYFEMPPLPPAGSFDVRFSSNRMAEDLSSSVQTIDMTSVEYPVTVTVENMSIRLMDETGKQLNENVEDGKQITINDSRISKLKVSGELIPTVYALEQNYPNPFNPSTTIEFSLPEDVNSVKLTIYNALGERVAELVNGSLMAGKYSYNWNARDVATGMYIYELRTDNFVSIKKMVLMK